jgi:hypothetical protein
MVDTSNINNVVFAVGRHHPSGVSLLGTAFLTARPGHFVTASHVSAQSDQGLVIVFKQTVTAISDYQDTSDQQVQMLPATISATDPFHDLSVLKADISASSNIRIAGTDHVPVGGGVMLFGYPHANTGRLVLTRQDAEIGARILIQSGGIKARHVVLNVQARPGQSGSPVLSAADGSLVAIVVGSYAPTGGGGISLGGVDPHTLHQTTHAVSAEYIAAML